MMTPSSGRKSSHGLAPTSTPSDLEKTGEGQTADAVFGEITEDGPNYRSVGWIGTSVLMMKTQIGLGVLALPAAFDALGMVPGIICLLVIAIVTLWSNYIVGQFKINHPDVYSVADVGMKMFGPIGREIFNAAYVLLWVFVAASGMLSISIGLNALSEHGTCTAVFVAVAAILDLFLSSIQTLGRISVLAWIGLIGLLAAIFTLTVSVGLQDRPSAAPREGPWESDYKIIGNPTFAEASAGLASIVLAYCGTPAYFNIVSEMAEPKHYMRAVIVCQSVMTVIFLVIGIVVYYFCGSYVASPALGSAGPLMKKICYGLALPGLIASMMLLTHFAAKTLFVRILRKSSHLNRNTFKHWTVWLSCTGSVTIIAYIIASAIPVFSGLVSLVGALFGTFMCFQPMGCMWLFDNYTAGKQTKSLKWMFMIGWCLFVIVSGSFLMVAGTYGSIIDIMDSYKAAGGSAAWSCADNSNST